MRVSERLAEFTRNLKPENAPPDVVERAKYLILDAIGCGQAATQYEFAARMLAGFQAMNAGEAGRDACGVIGMSAQLPVRDAAAFNAALVHGLDYDDTHMSAVVHASCVALPTALALGERVNATGADILSAYMAGMEVAIRVGDAANYGFHANGYHATGVVGHFSSALVAGRLLGLSAEQLISAQGIVVSTATASREFMSDGAWNKRLHPGWGAVAGITAAYLAKEGFDGCANPYDGRFGIYAMHLGGDAGCADLSKLTDGLGQRWELASSAVKPFPTCHYTHALADSALALRKQMDAAGTEISDITRIRILAPEPVLPVMFEPEDLKKCPTTDYAAKFSAPYVVSCCLRHERLGLRELEPEALVDRDVLALCQLCEPEADPETLFPEAFSGGVVIETKNGRQFRHYEAVNRGAGDRQLSNDDIATKFFDNAAMSVSEGRATKIRNRVLNFEKNSGAELMAVLSGQ
ncbi:MAG: MmgE/PrpD family protein [Rhodospirillaceae bacterium]|nr:MmgE/PrpD family protein [Rhodospirillaceae bacterium]